MKLKNKGIKIHLPVSLLFLIFIVNMIIFASCQRKKNSNALYIEPPISYESDTPQVSWNILFKQGTDKTAREKIITKIQDAVKNSYVDYYKTTGKDYRPKFFPVIWCPCDSLLYNMGFSSVDGSGGSVSKPPTGRPTIPGSGENIASFVDNINISEPDSGIIEFNQYQRDTVPVKNITINKTKKLAIIDSGIDTLLFSPNIKKLIWRDNMPSTLFNFLPFQNQADLRDGTRQRHGSAVTATVIKAMENAGTYPKLMILKALDNKNKGTIFSVSCALSYAIQKEADIINLSLGYYGQPDPILEHYLSLCSSPNRSIDVFAAAGNMPNQHSSVNLCNNHFNNNELTAKRLFYPACFSTQFTNLTAVTQLSSAGRQCFYQNFSHQFVTLGIFDRTNCCAIKVAFLGHNPSYFEGSSFATPVASGLKMEAMLQSATTPSAFWNSLIKINTSPQVTVLGKYIEYDPTWP